MSEKINYTVSESSGRAGRQDDGDLSSDLIRIEREATARSLEYSPTTEKGTPDLIEEEDEYTRKVVEDDSPYPEVRAAVPSCDDPTVLQSTVRVWVLGLFMTTLGSAVNMLLSMHRPSITITAFIASLAAWPIGLLWAKYVPDVKLFGKWGPSLNPGPFNVKEHALVTIMGNVSFGGGSAYATDILLAMHIPHFYNRQFSWMFDFCAVISTQCIGFCFAGLCQKILVAPGSMIWPTTLVTSTFLTNLHINQNFDHNTWKMSRLKFFTIVLIAGFIYYWLPGYLFSALSYFAFPTWFAPKNVLVNQIFGASTGLGLIPITFDWNQISGYVGSPLVPPVGVILTILVSIVSIYWIFIPIIHYTNIWYGKYLPISSSQTFDRFQNVYTVSKVVNPNSSLDLEAYRNYSQLYLPTTFAVSYGMSFASVTSTVVHTFLFYRGHIMQALRAVRNDSGDVHNRLMRNYKQTPWYWYVGLLCVFFPLSIITITVWETEMPIWALLLALFIATFFLIPVGIIYAVTTYAVGLNVITELIIGYLLPGRPIAMMFFKTFGYITNSQALTFAADMKLGHYMKLAPRTLFTAQFVAAVWGAVVQVMVLRWAEANIDGLCSTHQTGGFSCPAATVFFNASIVWGVIGPAKMFSRGQLYAALNYFFLAGAVLPIVNWLILNKWPKSLDRWARIPQFCATHLLWPIFFTGTGMIPPSTPYNYGAYCIVGIAFGYYVRRYRFHWWTKYNYTLSVALDVGLAACILVMFFALTVRNVDPPRWWGNTVIETLEYNNEAIQVRLKDGEYFGPSSWK
ncbi:HDL331Cp [Eremothecium sinecaudum]|uniref:HDL331Cp n=1 Tax=Eremothecium sinecaudum TaxID=45286 RepID=A0A109UYU9_9SACH|nr:HDL331Cp [Eremothecium sinecaudum]AMD20413.1 HDL331Cp [Eremothecium sinecaudum]